MTPPVRPEPEWTDPDALTLHDALLLAEQQAIGLGVAYTVCAMIDRGKLGYRVLMSASYAELRETKRAGHLAPVASVLPAGRTEIYDSYYATVSADSVREALMTLARRSHTRHYLNPETRNV